MNCVSYLIETLPIAYARHRIITDAQDQPVDFVFLTVNATFEAAMGLKRSDILHKRATEVLPTIENSWFDWICMYGRVALYGERHTFEQFSEPLQRWYEVTVYSDEKYFFTTVFDDITDRKEIRDALRKQKDKMDLLLEISSALANEKRPRALAQSIVDGITRLTWLRTAAIYLLDGDTLRLEATQPPLPEDFPDHLRLAPLEDHPHIKRAIAEQEPVIVPDSNTARLTAAERYVTELRQLRSILYIPLVYKGESIGVLIPCSTEKTHKFSRGEIEVSQTLAGHAALAITEARLFERQERYIAEVEEQNRRLEQAEQAIREREGRISDILRYAETVAFITTDADPLHPRIVDFSPGAERIFGYDSSEALGRRVGMLHTPEDIERFPEIMQSLSENRDGFSGESYLIRKDGEVFPALFKTHPVFDDQGNLTGTVGVSIDITERKRAEDRMAQALERYRKGLSGVVHSMGTLMSQRDNYTAEHQMRVAHLAVAIARKLGLEETRIEGIRLAAEIHDIGKISIPAEILTRPHQLTELHFRIIRTHPRAGYEILHSIDFPWPIADIVDQHHEKLDGSGYPEGRCGDGILLEARIICVADVVEALASHRPYRPARGIDAALSEILNNRDRLFDGQVVDTCLDLFKTKEFAFD